MNLCNLHISFPKLHELCKYIELDGNSHSSWLKKADFRRLLLATMRYSIFIDYLLRPSIDASCFEKVCVIAVSYMTDPQACVIVCHLALLRAAQ